jgi:outer membrane protein assembly factor BamB
VSLYWAAYLIPGWVGVPMFTRFLASLAACLLLTVLFTAWWLFSRRLGRGERWWVLGAAAAGGALAAVLSDKAGMVAWLVMALPWVFTTWTAWLLLARRLSARGRRLGLLAVLCLTWGSFTLIRFDGLTGEGQAVMHWRWTPTAEQLYLDQLAREAGSARRAAGTAPEALRLRPGDWPGFRGPKRNGEVHGLEIATDWATAPPRRVWRRRVGPAWSSVAVVGDRLFTQEQRGGVETVVCLDVASGGEVWAHADAVRFRDDQAGAGPRATPTFAEGRLYALGATGILNCLDAATGKRQWSRDVVAEAGARVPIWGCASSPLVVGGKVFVFAGGNGDNSLRAYDAGSGTLAWAAAAGQMSYSSPQPASFDGVEQILFLGDRGLTAFRADSGQAVWELAAAAGGPGLPRSTQPHVVASDQVLIAAEDIGTALIGITHDDHRWAANRRWASRAMKASFNDFVVDGGFVYGFDGGIFCCVDLQTGKPRWKQGRYGHGQVLLLGDQHLLLIVSERGEVVLLTAEPGRSHELGQFQALEGKTWNHPVIAHGRLYVRNAEWMARYDLGQLPAGADVPARRRE